MTDYQRSNLRFLAGAVSVISALALSFMLLSWLVGGTPYFRDVLLGEASLPLLVVLIVIGGATENLLRKQEKVAISGKPVLNP